jgi:hypothetical protein
VLVGEEGAASSHPSSFIQNKFIRASDFISAILYDPTVNLLGKTMKLFGSWTHAISIKS